MNNYGIALSQSGRLSEAVTQYKKSLEISPGDEYTIINLSTALLELNRFDEAISGYNLLLSKNKKIFAVYQNLGLAYYKTGQYEKSVSNYLEALKVNPDSLDTAMQAAGVLFNLKKIDEAVKMSEYSAGLAEKYGKYELASSLKSSIEEYRSLVNKKK
jgi:superkiller protein 3